MFNMPLRGLFFSFRRFISCFLVRLLVPCVFPHPHITFNFKDPGGLSLLSHCLISYPCHLPSFSFLISFSLLSSSTSLWFCLLDFLFFLYSQDESHGTTPFFAMNESKWRGAWQDPSPLSTSTNEHTSLQGAGPDPGAVRVGSGVGVELWGSRVSNVWLGC